MRRNQLEDVDLSSAENFENILAETIARATAQGVDVRGAWEFSTRGSTPNWEVNVVELAKEFGD